ncbi:MAG: fatty acid metabolism transcriptional regulator FadR [Anaerolineales bacterium]
MTNFTPPPRPFEYAEQALLSAILDGTFPPGSLLPGERDLAAQLGIARPALREVLARLARDGWLTIQHGKATRVNDYWREGGLNVLSALVRLDADLPPDFIPNLLDARLALAPAYARLAVERQPEQVAAYLADAANLADAAEAFAPFDWVLHQSLTIASQNPIYTLILNGFGGFYEQMALRYFRRDAARAHSRQFYTDLLAAAQAKDPTRAETVTRQVMRESFDLWNVS